MEYNYVIAKTKIIINVGSSLSSRIKSENDPLVYFKLIIILFIYLNLTRMKLNQQFLP